MGQSELMELSIAILKPQTGHYKLGTNMEVENEAVGHFPVSGFMSAYMAILECLHT